MSAQTLLELLSENGFQIKNTSAGKTSHVRCPSCEGGRSNEPSCSVTIDQDGRGFVWNCHRGKCGANGSARIPSEKEEREWKPQPRHLDPHKERHVTAALLQWFARRGIGKETVERFGCYEAPCRFPQVGLEPAIVFPYVWRGELANRKYRRLSDKHPMAQERDATPTLFNADRLLDSPDTVVWVEGEPDVMALSEAGCEFPAVSLKDGAGAGAMDKRLAALATHSAEIGNVKKFILAGDNDEPGRALTEELARRLGRHRSYLVTWPEGCKDANEVLLKCGPSALLSAVDDAQPYPISGVMRIQPGKTIREWLSAPPPRTFSAGTPGLSSITRIPGDGRLIVITGIPNHGKSTFTIWLATDLMKRFGRKFGAYSPEMYPWQDFVAHAIECWVGMPIRPGQWCEAMSLAQAEDAEAALAKRLYPLACDGADEAPTLDWMLERASALVTQHGMTDFLIDPWNELEHVRGNATMTEYIAACLQKLKHWGQRYGCNVWLIAHPVKLHAEKPGGKIPVPTAYDIDGSASWSNRADLILAVHTPDIVTEIHVLKARHSRWGKRGTTCNLEFDPLSKSYRDPLPPPEPFRRSRQEASDDDA